MRPLSEKQETRIAEWRKLLANPAGPTPSQLARKEGFSRQYMRDLCLKHRITVASEQVRREAYQTAITVLYAQGKTIAEVAEALETKFPYRTNTPANIRTQLRRAGETTMRWRK